MTNSKIIFEKVSDINSEYPYLCIYFSTDLQNPFMEISINNEKQLEYTVYSNKKNITLHQIDWKLIDKMAEEFFIETLTDNFQIN